MSQVFGKENFMRKTLYRVLGLSAVLVLCAGGLAAQSLAPDVNQEQNPTGLDAANGRAFSHSVLAEFASPTG